MRSEATNNRLPEAGELSEAPALHGKNKRAVGGIEWGVPVESDRNRDQMAAFLRRIPPFHGMASKEIQRLALYCDEISYRKGETIYQEGEYARSVWVLRQGSVRILKSFSDGKTMEIESLKPGELFGVLCRLGAHGRTYPCTAIAAEPSRVIRMTDERFLGLMKESSGVASGVCSLCSQRLAQVHELICSSHEPAPLRLARHLLRQAERNSGAAPITKKELAEMAGIAVETSFRILQRFRKLGWVSTGRRSICVLKPAAIQDYISRQQKTPAAEE